MLTENTLFDHAHNHLQPTNGVPKHPATFAELLADYEPEPMHRGQYVTGKILRIDQNSILADVDAKRTAVVPPQDIAELAEDELQQLATGDEVTLYVLRTPVDNEELLVSLNKGLEYQDWLCAQEHLANKDLLTLKVVGHNKGGILVAFGHLQGFAPTSHVPELQNIYNPRQLASRKAKLVGQELPMQVIEVNQQDRRLVLSAKKAHQEQRKQRLLQLKRQEGELITGHVTNLVKFGAFVDLDGIEGLIHISEIAWEHVDDPAQYLKPGMEVNVLIKSVDMKKERISLSRKAVLESPWELFAQKHAPGETIEGVVTNVADFGAFVLVGEGIEGLIHTSEIRGMQGFEPQDVLASGDIVLARILRIEPERQRLALSQRRLSQHEEMEWIWQRGQSATTLNESQEQAELVYA